MINVGTNITQNRPIFRDGLINKTFIIIPLKIYIIVPK